MYVATSNHGNYPKTSGYQSTVSNSEHASDYAALSCIPGLNIFRVICSDDVFTSFGMVHHRLVVREEVVETPVEETSRDERVEISNREQALTSKGHGGRAAAGHDNAIDKAR